MIGLSQILVRTTDIDVLDVLIVGGGVVLAAAAASARDDRNVAVLDRATGVPVWKRARTTAALFMPACTTPRIRSRPGCVWKDARGSTSSANGEECRTRERASSWSPQSPGMKRD